MYYNKQKPNSVFSSVLPTRRMRLFLICIHCVRHDKLNVKPAYIDRPSDFHRFGIIGDIALVLIPGFIQNVQQDWCN